MGCIDGFVQGLRMVHPGEQGAVPGGCWGGKVMPW
jgi:hypothetical protein